VNAAASRHPRASLVDGAEQALRTWLAPGRHREGDRLPPEHELAAMLGISRGTLRTALRRLAETGEIVRRQGSGTFVGRLAAPGMLSEGLERLEAYASLARRREVHLAARDVHVGEVALTAEVAAELGTAAGVTALQISRVVLADGRPAALMVDTLHPSTPAPPLQALCAAIEEGLMVLDVLTDHGVPIAFCDTRISTAEIAAEDPRGRALGLGGPTAMLVLDEVYFITAGQITHHSRDLFTPGGIDLRVVRWVEAQRPDQVGGTLQAAPVAGSAARGRPGKR
jgi:GntR family transcriptional regulator